MTGQDAAQRAMEKILEGAATAGEWITADPDAVKVAIDAAVAEARREERLRIADMIEGAYESHEEIAASAMTPAPGEELVQEIAQRIIDGDEIVIQDAAYPKRDRNITDVVEWLLTRLREVEGERDDNLKAYQNVEMFVQDYFSISTHEGVFLDEH